MDLTGLALLLASTWLACQGPTDVVLGGPREVVATIGGDTENYLVTVKMRAVLCFDPATNRKLNQQKARLMAIRALVVHTKGDSPNPAGQIEVSRTEVVSSSLRGDTFEQTTRIPKAAISSGVAVKGGRGDETDDRRGRPVRLPASPDGDFFSRKQDHLETLGDLNASIVQDLRALRIEEPTPEGSDRFYRRIVDFEEAQVDRLDKLRREVNVDKLLLNPERREVLAEVKRREKEILHDLSEVVKAYEVTLEQSTNRDDP